MKNSSHRYFDLSDYVTVTYIVVDDSFDHEFGTQKGCHVELIEAVCHIEIGDIKLDITDDQIKAIEEHIYNEVFNQQNEVFN
jgi:hypothetical protein